MVMLVCACTEGSCYIKQQPDIFTSIPISTTIQVGCKLIDHHRIRVSSSRREREGRGGGGGGGGDRGQVEGYVLFWFYSRDHQG